MTRLLIAGWRGISHSFAMVNQQQILALARRGDIVLSHLDMPLAMPHWNVRDYSAGFTPEETALIDGLSPADEGSVDCVYRIGFPMYAPGPSARRTLTFAVTELSYEPCCLQDPRTPLAAMTEGQNLVVTPSRWSRDRLIDFGFDEGRVRVVRHGVDLEVFRPQSQDEILSQRRSLGIPDEAVVFLNVGVPNWNKGLDLLIRAFVAVHQRHPHVRLVLKDSSALYGLSSDVVFRGLNRDFPGLLTSEVLADIMLLSGNLSRMELCRLYGFVDSYVSPYRAEGFNLPVLEAQGCGTPVIVSSGGATDEFCNGEGVSRVASVFHRGALKDMTNCCWVEPQLESLEAAMEAVAVAGPRAAYAQDPIRQAARRNAEQYSWDRAAAELVALL